MRQFFTVIFVVFCFTANAKSKPGSETMTGANICLVNEGGVIVASIGNYLAGSLLAQNIEIQSGNYHFMTYWMGGERYLGGTGFPIGQAGSGGFFFVPEGVYNVHYHGWTDRYNFVPVSAQMLISNDYSYNLNDDGNGNYSVENVVLPQSYARFYFSELNSGTYFGGTFPSGQSTGSENFINVPAGTYTVTINQNGFFNFMNTLSNVEFESKLVKAYPNPTNNEWNFSSMSDVNSIAIYNDIGQAIFTQKIFVIDFNIDASSFPNGIYFAQIKGEKTSATLKLIKK